MEIMIALGDYQSAGGDIVELIESSNLLHHAARKNQVDTLKIYLDVGTDKAINMIPEGEQDTPLQNAIKKGNIQCAAILLLAGADVMKPSSKGKETIEFAMECEKSKIGGLLDLLIENGMDINPEQEDKQTMLFAKLQSNDEARTHLALRGCSIAQVSSFLDACQNGKLHLVTWVLELGISPNVMGPEKIPGIVLACQNGHTDIVLHLLSGETIDYSWTDKDGNDLLQMACKLPTATMFEELLASGKFDLQKKLNKKGHDHLDLAMLSNSVEVFNVLVEKHNMQLFGGEGQVELWFRCLHVLELLPSMKKEMLDNVFTEEIVDTMKKVLLEMGNSPFLKLFSSSILDANFDLAKIYQRLGQTLHTAISNGNSRMASLLLELGAVPLDKTLVAAVRKNQTETIIDLLQHGANANARTGGSHDERVCLQVAIKKSNHKVVTALMEAGADPTFTDKWENSCAHVAAAQSNVKILEPIIVFGGKPALNALDQNGWTPLHKAAKSGHMNCCKVLVENGANINAETDHGYTCIGLAAREDNMDIVRYLHKNGGNINIPIHEEVTSVQYSAIFEELDQVEDLIECGADPNFQEAVRISAKEVNPDEEEIDFLRFISAAGKAGALDDFQQDYARPVHNRNRGGGPRRNRFYHEYGYDSYDDDDEEYYDSEDYYSEEEDYYRY
eukprot:TRINITY_DN2071_c0_g2_i1.p1 TRINITY_DN2071_c0_g2~~TRINITY_DN2071_c0_g2_i1.p1  ORF type:complete len:674 (+),score=244.98 TRINITY_DN2071_c0_g2_i1:1585-3606(+)